MRVVFPPVTAPVHPRREVLAASGAGRPAGQPHGVHIPRSRDSTRLAQCVFPDHIGRTAGAADTCRMRVCRVSGVMPAAASKSSSSSSIPTVWMCVAGLHRDWSRGIEGRARVCVRPTDSFRPCDRSGRHRCRASVRASQCVVCRVAERRRDTVVRHEDGCGRTAVCAVAVVACRTASRRARKS